MSRALGRFLAQPGAAIGAVLVVALVALAVLGPALAAKDPLAADIDRGLTELGAPRPPSADALLGTDTLGRDVWARVIAGTRTSLAIAGLATLLSLVIGLAIGLTAGYAGGAIDNVLMRLVDLVLAFPFLLLAIMLAALFHQSGMAASSRPVVITLGAVGWTTMARVLRTQALVLARSDLVTAARAVGAGPARIILGHLLPNVAGTVLALALVGFAQNLLAESMLSYLGLGPAPPAPTWGRMLFEGRAYFRIAPHLVLVPGAAICLAVVAFHLLGNGLRDAAELEAPARGEARA